MRCAVLLLFLSAAAVAEDRFAADLEAFNEVKGLLTTFKGKDRIYAALDRLVEGGDPRAVEPLARYVVEALAVEDATRAALRKVQKQGGEAKDKMDAIDDRVGEIAPRIEAGDPSAKREFENLMERRKRAAREADQVSRKSGGLRRTIGFLFDLRPKVAAGLGKMLGGLEGEQLTKARAKLREVLDIADARRAALLVEILHASRQAAVASDLVAVIDHPKVEPHVRVAAVIALGRIRTAEAYAALVRIAESDETTRAQILHALGMAAGRRFEDLKQAKAWVGEQG
jgi:HEAT repeat protein